MDRILGILAFIAAIILSTVAAFYSIKGMTVLFAANAFAIAIMMAGLEFAKVITASWLHHNWSNNIVTGLHKAYMTVAVIALVAITSLGVYGFLSASHLEQAAPMAGTNLQIQQGELRIQQLQADNERLTTRLNQLDQSVNVMLGQDRASQGLRARNQQKAERAEINTAMDANNQQIQKLQSDLLPLRTANLEVEAKLGPVKYVAELFGWKDPEAAVRLIILVIMVAFDPLALVLIISGGISLRQYQERKRLEAEARRDEDFQGIMAGLEDAVEMQKAPVVDKPVEVDAGALFTIEEHKPQVVVEDENAWKSEDEVMRALEADRAAYPFMQELEAHDAAHEEVKESQPVAEVEVAEEVVTPVESEDEQKTPTLSEKDQLIEMLEKNPDILQDIIEVVDTFRKPVSHTLELKSPQ